MKRLFYFYLLVFHSSPASVMSNGFSYSRSNCSSESSYNVFQAMEKEQERKKTNFKSNGANDCHDNSQETESSKDTKIGSNNSSKFQIPLITLVVCFVVYYNIYIKDKDNDNGNDYSFINFKKIF